MAGVIHYPLALTCVLLADPVTATEINHERQYSLYWDSYSNAAEQVKTQRPDLETLCYYCTLVNVVTAFKRHANSLHIQVHRDMICTQKMCFIY